MTTTTKAALARELGVSAPYFVELVRRGMPTLLGGKLHREATLRWLIDNSDPRRPSKVVPRAEELLNAHTEDADQAAYGELYDAVERSSGGELTHLEIGRLADAMWATRRVSAASGKSSVGHSRVESTVSNGLHAVMRDNSEELARALTDRFRD